METYGRLRRTYRHSPTVHHTALDSGANTGGHTIRVDLGLNDVRSGPDGLSDRDSSIIDCLDREKRATKADQGESKALMETSQHIL